MIEDGVSSFLLSDGERSHPLWVRLRAHLESRLALLRAKNDGALTEYETATLRGQIKCLKGLIALGDNPPIDG
jgi:hypothetical protein